VPATISTVPMPAMAPEPSTYPYGLNDRLDWDYLNWGFEFNWDVIPPHGSQGGAGSFNQWIDISNAATPILRQCVVPWPSRATAGVYVPSEWMDIGYFDIPIHKFYFNGGDVEFDDGLIVWGNLNVHGTITGDMGPMPYLPLTGGTLSGPLNVSGQIYSNNNMWADGSINAAQYTMRGRQFATSDTYEGGYNILHERSGAQAIYLGPSSYYRADSHIFQNKAGNGAGDLTVGYITAAGNVTLTAPAQLSVGGITNLGYVNVSGNVVLSGAAALTVAGISNFGAINASGNITTTGSAKIVAGGSAGFEVSTGNTTLRATTVNGTTALNGAVSIQGNTTMLGTSQLTVGGNGTFQAALTCNGTIYYGALSALSDAAVKSDIAPYTTGLDAIKQLDPVSFTYIPALKIVPGTKYGLMADDVRPVIPEMVGETEVEIDGVPQTVATISPDHLWYVLINATKELAARVEALEVAR
jgi:hypothetical protein